MNSRLSMWSSTSRTRRLIFGRVVGSLAGSAAGGRGAADVIRTVVPSPCCDSISTSPRWRRDDAVHLSQAESRALLPLGGEEGLERALADLGGHADCRSPHFELNLVLVEDGGMDGQGAAGLHRVERVLDEIEQRFAELAGDAAHERAGGELPLELDLAASRPLRPRAVASSPRLRRR